MGVGWCESDDRNPTLPSITSIRCNIIDAAWWMYLLVASSPLPPPCFPLPNSILPDRNGSMKFPPRFQDSLSFTIIRNPSIFYQSTSLHLRFEIEPSDLWDGISSRSIVKGEGRDSSLCFSYSFLPLSLPFFFSRNPTGAYTIRKADHNGASLLATDNNESWWQWRFNQLILLSFYLNCESFLIIILSQRNNFRNNFNFWIRITFPPFQTTFFLRRVATISSDTASLHSSLGNRSYWNNLHKCKKW